jgi:hypothetical protein
MAHDWSIEIPIAKADDEHHTVYGWAVMADQGDGQPVVDMDGDVIAPDELVKAAHHFMLTARNVGVEHADYGPHLGQVVESVVMTPTVRKAMGLDPNGPTGWFVGMKIHDDDVWKGVKDGTYSAFSIGGSGTRTPIQ